MFKLLVFKCQDCEHKFEELVDPEEVPECPECKSKNVEKASVQSHNPRHVSWSIWAAGN